MHDVLVLFIHSSLSLRLAAVQYGPMQGYSRHRWLAAMMIAWIGSLLGTRPETEEIQSGSLVYWRGYPRRNQRYTRVVSYLRSTSERPRKRKSAHLLTSSSYPHRSVFWIDDPHVIAACLFYAKSGTTCRDERMLDGRTPRHDPPFAISKSRIDTAVEQQQHKLSLWAQMSVLVP